MFKSLRTLPRLRPLIPPITTSPHNHIIPPRPKSTYESTSDAKIPSREDLNPTSWENTGTGTHDEVAHADSASYDPDLTDPGRERESAGAEVRIIWCRISPHLGGWVVAGRLMHSMQEKKKKTKSPGNPLDASPANPGIGLSGGDGRAEVNAGKWRGGRRSGGSKDA